jgi:hypothetical protein
MVPIGLLEKYLREWFDVAPLRVTAWWKDLQTAEPVEKDSYASKVGMFAQRRSPVVHWLRWRLDKSDLIPSSALETVHVLQRVGW